MMANVNDDDKAVAAGGLDPIESMDADALMAEVRRLRSANKALNRRATGADAPWQGRAMRAESMSKHYKESNWHNFERLCRAHDSLRDIYLALYEVRGLPLPKFHSVMDSRCDGRQGDGRQGDGERVWANVYLKSSGGMESECVVEAVRRFLAGTWLPIDFEYS